MDDLTHFLIAEAVMDRFYAERRKHDLERERRDDAKRKSRELLDQRRGGAA